LPFLFKGNNHLQEHINSWEIRFKFFTSIKSR